MTRGVDPVTGRRYAADSGAAAARRAPGDGVCIAGESVFANKDEDELVDGRLPERHAPVERGCLDFDLAGVSRVEVVDKLLHADAVAADLESTAAGCAGKDLILGQFDTAERATRAARSAAS